MIQSDKLNMVLFLWFLVTFSVYTTLHVYTGQVTFYKVPETHDHVELITLY